MTYPCLANDGKYPQWRPGLGMENELLNNRFIFMPFANGTHWRLAIFAYCGCRHNSEDRHLIILDSLDGTARLGTKEQAQLLKLWNYFCEGRGEEPIKSFSKIPVLCPPVGLAFCLSERSNWQLLSKVPSQRDIINCGLSPAHYMKAFLSDPDLYYSICVVSVSLLQSCTC
jgi:Ulp1 family protease